MGAARVLHVAPGPQQRTGIAAYAARFRSAVSAAGTRIVPLDTGGATGAMAIRRHVRTVRAAAERADIVHFELGGGGLADFYAARALADEPDAPVVLTLHDPPRAVWRPFDVPPAADVRAARAALRILDPLARRMERRLIESAAAVFALSAKAATGRIVTLPYPVFGESIAEPPPRAAELSVGYHGYWYAGKGIERLVSAVLETGGVSARIWGGPPDTGTPRAHSAYADRVRAAAGSCARIVFPGPLADHEVGSALAACDVVVLPHEDPRRRPSLASVSASVFDAFAVGTPVVTTPVRGIGDAVSHGVNGLLVAPGDTPALAAALRRLRDDPALCGRLREGARATAMAHDPARTAEIALATYARVLRSRTG